MFWFQLVVVLLLLAAVGWLAVGGGGHMSEPVPDRADLALPGDRPVAARDLDRVRFSVGLRGYRMAEVDDVLDRLAREVEVRDRRIAQLEGRPYGDTAFAAGSVDEALAAGSGDGESGPAAESGAAADSGAATEIIPAAASTSEYPAGTEIGSTVETGPEAGSGPDLPPLPRD